MVAVVRAGKVVGVGPGTAQLHAARGPTTATVAINVPTDADTGAFRPPFAGSVSVSNVFDHNLPFEFSDNNGFLLSFWGEKVGGIDGHNGYDWTVPEGTPVLASAAGTVTFAGLETPFVCTLLNNSVVAGNWISIEHGVATHRLVYTQYGHLSRIDVSVGQRVQAGQQLGLSGTTGCSTGPHLHFSAYRTDHPGSSTIPVMDPYGWQSTSADPWAADARGTTSIAIWSSQNAPEVYTEFATSGSFPKPRVASVPRIRIMGVDDDHHPNNEFIDVDINPDLTSLDLTGFTILNAAGAGFTFPAGFTAHGGDTVRVFSGKGTNTAKTLFMGRDTPLYGDQADCAVLFDQLHRALGGAIWRSSPCAVAQTAATSANSFIRPAPTMDFAPSSAGVQRLGVRQR